MYKKSKSILIVLLLLSLMFVAPIPLSNAETNVLFDNFNIESESLPKWSRCGLLQTYDIVTVLEGNASVFVRQTGAVSGAVFPIYHTMTGINTTEGNYNFTGWAWDSGSRTLMGLDVGANKCDFVFTSIIGVRTVISAVNYSFAHTGAGGAFQASNIPLQPNTWFQVTQILGPINSTRDWLQGNINGTEIFNITITKVTSITFQLHDPFGGVIGASGNNFDLVNVTQLGGEAVVKAAINGALITNLEVCGDWVFADEKYYNFQILVGGGSIIDSVWLQFSDVLTNTTFKFDNIAKTRSHITGQNITTLGSVTTSLNTATNVLTVNFPILFRSLVIDTLDVDIVARANDTNGIDTGWVTIQANFFNIYNEGGLVQTVTSGTAGRVTGGDTFELQAANLTWAKANQTFRKIQQYRSQFSLRLSDEAAKTGFVIGFQDFDHSNAGAELYMDKGDWQIEAAMNYCDQTVGVMVKGFYVIIEMESGDLGNNDLWTSINATWYDRDDTKIKSDLFTVWPETQAARIRFWIDLWYNKINSSSVGGGRINAYYTGMDTTAFLLWQGGWSPMITNATDSMAFISLKNNASEFITSPQLDLMSVSFNISRPANSAGTDGRNITATLQNWQQQDYKFALRQMIGIDTPTPVETKVPDMPVTGFFAPLIAAVLSIGSWVASGIAGLALVAWAALDSQFPFLTQGLIGIYELLTGFGNFFISITNNVTQMLVFLAEQLWLITIFTDMIVDSFTFIMGWVTPFLSQADSWIILFLVVFIIIPFAGMAAQGDLKGMESDIRKLGGILNTMLEWSIRLIQVAIQFIIGLKPF